MQETVALMVASGDYDIATRAAKFLADTTEIENIKSTIETQTAWMTKPMRDDMCTAKGVDLRACTERPTTVYVIIPTVELMAKATYLRLLLSSALRALYRHGGVPTTLLIEEGFVLGHHAEIEQANAILRGYGSRLTIVFQSLQQIKRLYPETWGLFMAGATLAFRPADLETAEWMSKRSGEVIKPVLSAADPSSPNDLGARPSWQQQKRERIPVGKMFGMPQGRALAWLSGDDPPRIVRVKGYFDIPKLNARASPNPYHRNDKPKAKRATVWLGAAGIIGAFAFTLGPHISSGPAPAKAGNAPHVIAAPVIHHRPAIHAQPHPKPHPRHRAQRHRQI